jgi:hypothetical protein
MNVCVINKEENLMFQVSLFLLLSLLTRSNASL